MSNAEKFIKGHIRNYSNEWYDDLSQGYESWLTPNQARKAVEIAREETIKEVCEWLDNHLIDYWSQSVTDESRFIEGLKEYLEEKK